MDSWGPGAHSSTFTGYPTACAGGLKVFEIFERDHILEQAAEKARTSYAGSKIWTSGTPPSGISTDWGFT